MKKETEKKWEKNFLGHLSFDDFRLASIWLGQPKPVLSFPSSVPSLMVPSSVLYTLSILYWLLF